MKRIVCLGGGPAGLYTAILLRKALPSASIEVYERNRPDDTFGWGVVFSDQTMANFRAADARSHAAIVGNFHHWDDIDIHFGGRRFVSGGHGFCGISRKRLLSILQERAAELGVRQTFEREVDSEAGLEDADLIVAADGANSKTRQRHEAVFEPELDRRKCRYIWLGTTHRGAVQLCFQPPVVRRLLLDDAALGRWRRPSRAGRVRGLRRWPLPRRL